MNAGEIALDDRTWVKAEKEEVAPPAPMLGKSFGIRAASYLVDIAIQTLVGFAVGFLVSFAIAFVYYVRHPSATAVFAEEYQPGWLLTVVGIVLLVLYFTLFEWLFGATPGKLMLGMRVVARDGGRCSAKAALARALMRYWDGLLFCIPALVSMKAPLFQRVGDKVAKTMVVGSGDTAIRESRHWGWFLAAGGLYTVLCLVVHTLVLLKTLTPGG